MSDPFPSVLTYQLSTPDELFRSLNEEVSRSSRSGLRVGLGWLPSDKLSIRNTDSDDAWIKREDLKSLDDVCTKFCTHKFFPHATSRINMVGNVIRVYLHLAKETGLKFTIVFKGGVMLRLVLLQFWRSFPDIASHDAIQYLHTEKAIGFGDFDFEIVPDDHHLAPYLMYQYLYVNTFALIWLQRQLVKDMASGESNMLTVGWDRTEAEEDLKKRVQAEVDGLPTTHPMHKAKVQRMVLGSRVASPPKGFTTRSGKPSPDQRTNLFIFACPDASTCVCEASAIGHELGLTQGLLRRCGAVGGGNDFLYTTCNMHINESPDPLKRKLELNPHFHLSRIKHTFTMYYTTKDGTKRCDRLAGEMLDLSMSHPHDEIQKWKYDNIGVSNAYRDYPIVGVKRVQFRSYSPQHFLKDHEQMVHRKDTPPWKVPKYAKRIVRYIAFLFVVVLSEETSFSLHDRVRGLLRLLRYVHTDMTQPFHPPTGIRTVDHFANVEHQSIVHDTATQKEVDEYRKTVRTHMTRMTNIALHAIGCLHVKLPFQSMDITHLDYMEHHKLRRETRSE